MTDMLHDDLHLKPRVTSGSIEFPLDWKSPCILDGVPKPENDARVVVEWSEEDGAWFARTFGVDSPLDEEAFAYGATKEEALCELITSLVCYVNALQSSAERTMTPSNAAPLAHGTTPEKEWLKRVLAWAVVGYICFATTSYTVDLAGRFLVVRVVLAAGIAGGVGGIL